MLTALVIAQNRTFAKELKARLKEAGPPGGLHIAVTILRGTLKPEDLSAAFLGLCDWIEEQSSMLSPGGPPRLLVVSDIPGSGGESWMSLNPVGPVGWPALLGMLILAFPEAHFLVCSEANGATLHELRLSLDVSGPLGLLASGYSPMFDAGGLRSLVRRVARDWLAREWGVTGDAIMPHRSKTVAAIDEEEGYAFFHAYVGYRFGFRAHVVKSYRMLQQLFAGDPCGGGASSDIFGVFEDVYLSFPDTPFSGLSTLETRDKELPGLFRVPNRVFVTRDIGLKNRDYFNNTQALKALSGIRWQEILKPVAGVFSLSRDRAVKAFFAESGYKWPLEECLHSAADMRGHSAPGRLLVISERLIRRAECLFESAQSIPTAIQGAVLATDALELLGERTPTASLEALSWKHQFEVLAESLFLGMEADIDLKDRFGDIGAELDAIAKQVQVREPDFFKNTAKAHILGRLIQVFRSRSQFEEEQSCIAYARRVHLQIRYSGATAGLPVKVLERYVNFLLVSLPKFCLVLVAWVLTLSVAYAVTRPSACNLRLAEQGGLIWCSKIISYLMCWAKQMAYGLEMTVTSFFSVGQPIYAESYLGDVAGIGLMFVRHVIVVISISGGLLHLGVFLSHLYALVSRK